MDSTPKICALYGQERRGDPQILWRSLMYDPQGCRGPPPRPAAHVHQRARHRAGLRVAGTVDPIQITLQVIADTVHFSSDTFGNMVIHWVRCILLFYYLIMTEWIQTPDRRHAGALRHHPSSQRQVRFLEL